MWATRGNWKKSCGVVAAIAVTAYATTYVHLRNRGISEIVLTNSSGMLYDSVENVEKSHDLSTHHFRSRIFAPLNAIDCMLFGGEPPVLGIMFDLQ